MKLINFLADSLFNGLRFDMKAPLIEAFVSRKSSFLDPDFIQRLGREGIDLDLGDIKVESDGTLSVKGRRVIAYIRDVSSYGGSYELPRYHLSYCRTLDSMHRKNRWQRYVAASRDDGFFVINVVDQRRSSTEKLMVCQNCLDHMRWNGFSYQPALSALRERIRREFSLKAFFEIYPKDLISIDPHYNSDNAPLNDYPDNWGPISEALKREKNYQCEDCSLNLSHDKYFVHVHHLDGQKNNVSCENLKVLCLGCHADQPMHSHMKALRTYEEFLSKYAVKR